MRKYNAESPKQGSRRFNYIVKTKYIDDLGIVNLWSTVSVYAQVQCQEPKTGQQKVQFYCEDEIYCRSGYSLSMTLYNSYMCASVFAHINCCFPKHIYSRAPQCSHLLHTKKYWTVFVRPPHCPQPFNRGKLTFASSSFSIFDLQYSSMGKALHNAYVQK